MPTLKYYQNLLGIDCIFGTQPKMNGDVIQGISEENFSGSDFKYSTCKNIIDKYSVDINNVYGIGDSYVEKNVIFSRP